MTMTAERFQDLAEAYGGLVARWPNAEREAASAFMAAQPAFARSVLQEAEGLDLLLDQWRVTPAALALQEKIVASAPAARPRRGFWLWQAGLGAGLAAACAAGLAVGMAFTTPVASDSLETVTASFSDYEALSAAAGDNV